MRLLPFLPVCLLACVPLCGFARTEAERLEFFERKIRPVLVSECVECHGEKKQKGGLRVDSREALRSGGDSGAAVVPGDPAKSLLLTSIKHLDPDLQMPAKKPKLDDETIAAFERWITEGADDPRDKPTGAEVDAAAVLSRAERMWSFKPVRRIDPPPVHAAEWSDHPVDRFLLAAMEAKGIAPGFDADANTLIRRLSYTLTGLPPSPEEVNAFVQSAAGDRASAIKAAVDRLLASPRFGEHFARHWMDVVRYAETHGSENDDILPEAWQFRDYLIRAFNRDVPFDQLVREHIAGDQLEEPRRSEGRNESVIGTGFWRFTEFNQSPVDVKREEGTIVENQIDALGKAFQGLTLSCARCHDHKFDPILQRDYYALYGIAASSRIIMQQLEEPASFHREDGALLRLKTQIKVVLAQQWKHSVEAWPRQLDEARAALHASGSLNVETDVKARPPGWLGVFRLPEATEPDHPLYVLARMARVKPDDNAAFETEWRKISARAAQEDSRSRLARDARVIGDFSRGDLAGWFRSGALPQSPTVAGEFTLAADGAAIVRSVQPAGYYSNLLSQRHGGSLRSPDFVLDGERIRVLACGERDARLRLVIENFQGDSNLFAAATRDMGSPHLRWFELNIREAWKGRRAYVELLTRDDRTYRGVVGKDQPGMHRETDGRSGFGVLRVLMERGAERSTQSLALTPDFWRVPPRNWEELVKRFAATTNVALEAWGSDWCDDHHARLLDALVEAGLFDNQLADGHPANDLIQKYREIESRIPIANRAPGLVDDPTARDVALQSRGDWKLEKETVPRAYLAVLGGARCGGRSSGRLALAEAIADSRNPLTARVYVNRVWSWAFGRGLVSSVDNFGSLGAAPSHPELLDYLAAEFVTHGWSTKWLVRTLATTRAWQLTSGSASDGASNDAAVALYARTPLRRLEAEMIRDGILTATGSLRNAGGGPSVPVWLPDTLLDEFRPKSGPLDGDNRRSVYLEVRRNFPTDFLRVFDQPKPSASVGRRSVTTVPAQSLALLNDPFVQDQASRWGGALARSDESVEAKLDAVYLKAFARYPDSAERKRAMRFLEQSGGVSDPAAWTELVHAIFNLKEFIFLR